MVTFGIYFIYVGQYNIEKKSSIIKTVVIFFTKDPGHVQCIRVFFSAEFVCTCKPICT